jgi:histidinol dehydrogenase
VRVERRDLGADPAAAAAGLRPRPGDDPELEGAVREIIERVRAEGDAVVLELTRRWDTGGAEPRPLRVDAREITAALEGAPADLRAALELAAINVRDVAAAGVVPDHTVTLPQGQTVRLREVPVRRAAVYVPGGRAPYPSTAIMGAVTAAVAGVEEVAVCTPPGSNGDASPAVLAACGVAGVREIYRMGGAQAIAAFAYGTDTVPAVDVVVGPGGRHAQEAKRQLSGRVGIDGFAGPSELLVVLDAEADPAVAALDLRAQAEHGPDSVIAAVGASDAVLDRLEQQLERLEDGSDLPPLMLLRADTLEGALAFAEALAPEHLQLMGPDAEALAPRVRSAGCVFVGQEAGTAFGDYVAGSNHVLPTSGAARFSSTLSPRHFRRRMAEVTVPGDEAGADLARAGAVIARAEGFPFHARSMEARFRDNG